MEQIWRSAGFGFSKRYKPEKKADSGPRLESSEAGLTFHQTVEFERRFFVRDLKPNDVALLGYENEVEEQAHLAQDVQRLLDGKALVLLFSSQKAADAIRKQLGRSEDLIPITHDVPDGGILQISGWPEKVC
jgi:hypothetical protein